MNSLRQQLVTLGAVKTETITVGDGETAATIEVQGLSAGRRGAILTACLVAGEHGASPATDLEKLGPMLVIAGACDPDTHQPIFGDADRSLVAGLDASFLDPIINAVSRLSGITAKAAADAEKNSSATTDSGSDSPSPASSV